MAGNCGQFVKRFSGVAGSAEERGASRELKETIRSRFAPHSVVLTTGRPRLHPAPVDFNISHEGGVAVAAVVPSPHKVGIDLADAACPVDFSASELAELFEPVPRGTDVPLFWAVREAWLKSLGVPDPGARARIDTAGITPGEAPDLGESGLSHMLQVSCSGVPVVCFHIDNLVGAVAIHPADASLAHSVLENTIYLN